MNYHKYARGIISSLCLCAVVSAQVAFAAVAGNPNAAPANSAPSAIIYDNGPFITGQRAKNGTAAPTGSFFSEVQNFGGDTATSNSAAGATCNQAGFRLADNFVVPVGETWTINQVLTFAYLTGGGATSPFTAGVLQIWNGRPGDTGSTVIFGDTTTNRLGSSTDTSTFRIFNSLYPTPSAPGTTRRIWQNSLTVSPALVLTSGNYWVDFGTTVNATPATAHFCPSTTIVDTRYTPLMNGRQFSVANNAWVDVLDVGTPDASAVDVPLDFPFKIDGTRSGARAVPYSRKVDTNGDNLTDYAVTRNVSGSKNWFTAMNGGTTSVQFGNSTDTNVAEDYDGDGRTDIAVWRGGNLGYFYILQSSTNTVRVEQFGQTGDDPTIVGDYDGDGKADPAVYRSASGSNPGVFYYRASASASGNITGIAFGAAGDKPYPGDFDGDRRFDASVVRNNGGNAQIFQQRTTQGFVAVNYGLFSDRFVSGDFDGDSRNDLAVVRDNGGVLTWYVSTSTTNQLITLNYGTTSTDTPTPGDYDGDSRTDFSVYRGGTFFSFGSLSPSVAFAFGQSGDTPVASYLAR